MKKNGFTLVEMVVILIFITIIALMSVPVITNMLKKGEDDKYNMFLDDVYLATEAYIEKYKDDYPYLNVNGSKTLVYMKDLVDEKLVSTNLVNPKYCVNDECIAKKIATCNDKTCNVDDYTIIVSKDEDGKYRYELHIGYIEPCDYYVGQIVFEEGYTGSIKNYTTLCTGRYKLEVWGAQGGKSGGNGGYSQGIISLTKDSQIYIGVGAAGGSGGGRAFNGGGAGNGGGYAGDGGGATHMAINTNRGVLSTYNGHLDELLIVAGGGGGNSEYGNKGGTGGGTSGTAGGGNMRGYGGTQTSGGGGTGYSGSFGQGGNAETLQSCDKSRTFGGGGGGGLYGGGGGGYTCQADAWWSGAGGGGSGYLSSGLTEATMENGLRTGHGYAKITYVGM